MLRELFVDAFGESQASAIERAAGEHRSMLHEGEKVGTDPFRDCIAIAIGFQCFEVPRYRQYHGITAPFEQIKNWVIEHADLGSHDGPIDYIAVMSGAYDPYIKREAA